MQYTRLGNSGLVVSRFAFGAMTFGHDSGPMGAVWKTGQQEADALVNRSLEAGVNFFDTADMYAGGQSETMLGKALGSRRKDVVISTKVGFRSNDALINAGASFRWRGLEARIAWRYTGAQLRSYNALVYMQNRFRPVRRH